MPHIASMGWFRLTDPTVANHTNSSFPAQQAPLLLRPDRPEDYHVHAVITFGLLIAILLHACFSHSKKAGVSGFFTLACLAMTAVLAPIIGSILLLLACYRQCVITLLKATCKKGTFGGLMQGNDAFWALEEDSSRSIINILALADFSFIVEASNHGEEPLRTVQELIEDRLLSHPAPFPKLLCYRKQKMGYFFWERQPYIDVNDHVRWMDYPEDQPDEIVSERVLKNYISSLTNAPLPAGHASGWEILISRYPLQTDADISDPLDAMENGMESGSRYPIMFRVHHTLGDGVALVRLLLDALADPCTRTPSRTASPIFEYSPTQLHHTEPNTPNNDMFKSNFLHIPYHQANLKKSASYNFEDYYENTKPISSSTSLGDCVRMACRKFISFLDEAHKINHIQYQTQSLHDINILVNDEPNKDFLHIVKKTNLNEITPRIVKPNRLLVTKEDKKKFECLFSENKSEENPSILQLIWNKIKNLSTITYHIGVLTMLPGTVMNQVITRTNDVNALHGPQLSGYKVVGWHFEHEDSDEKSLMSMIRRIRLRTGAHFSDVVLTALSSSFEEFYRQFNEIPHDITVVIPARLGRPDEGETPAKVSTAVFNSKDLKATVTKLYLDRNAKRNHSVLYQSSKANLDNKFSVALLTLPIASEPSTKEGLFGKLRRVQKHTDILRKSADYIVNYWILKVVATLFPIPCLRQMVKSTQSSLVVSNMPGPQKLAKLAGHLLHNIVFWVPNRETTGLGVTILSYGGRLQLGLIADRALIPCPEDAQLIVDGIVTAIQKMDKLSST